MFKGIQSLPSPSTPKFLILSVKTLHAQPWPPPALPSARQKTLLFFSLGLFACSSFCLEYFSPSIPSHFCLDSSYSFYKFQPEYHSLGSLIPDCFGAPIWISTLPYNLSSIRALLQFTIMDTLSSSSLRLHSPQSKELFLSLLSLTAWNILGDEHMIEQAYAPRISQTELILSNIIT